MDLAVHCHHGLMTGNRPRPLLVALIMLVTVLLGAVTNLLTHVEAVG